MSEAQSDYVSESTQSGTNPTNWEVFKGEAESAPERIRQLPPPPPWRQFRPPVAAAKDAAKARKSYKDRLDSYWAELQAQATEDSHSRALHRGQSFRIRRDHSRVIQAVNAALALRRPLLVTGRPGSGKTSLAYAVAYELVLGPVLMWPITARTTLEAGLYRYDAIARLQDAQLRKQEVETGETLPEKTIGDYIQLGPLGTAFLPAPYPRVLLIDEIDKSDINLPNDLLNLLEEGQFEISELVRLAESRQSESKATGQQSAMPMQVRTADDLKVPLEGGKVRCDAFPLIVMTSNGERDFPPAFLRRCLRIEMPKPAKEDLFDIVEAHLTTELAEEVNDLIGQFHEETDSKAVLLATDQLLNAVYLRKYGAAVDSESDLKKLLWAALTSTGG